MISHIHIFKTLLNTLLFDIAQEILYLLLVKGSEVCARVFFNFLGLRGLESFELNTIGPLFQELDVFFLFVEGGGRKFETPMRRVGHRTSTFWVGQPPILNTILIVEGLVEGPGVLFVKAMIDYGQVWVGWVRINRLTLEVIVQILLICVSSENLGGRSDGGAWFGREELLSFDTSRFVKFVIGRGR